MKTRIKSYNGKINTNFYINIIPKKDSQFIFLLIILIDPVSRTVKSYCCQVFLEECQYIDKEKKIHHYIIDDIENFDKGISDEESSDEWNSDEKNFFYKTGK